MTQPPRTGYTNVMAGTARPGNIADRTVFGEACLGKRVWGSFAHTPEGIDITVEPAGGYCFDQSLKLVRFEGRLITLRFSSGEIPRIRAGFGLPVSPIRKSSQTGLMSRSLSGR